MSCSCRGGNQGDLWMRHNNDDTLTIVRADPKIHVSGELLDMAIHSQLLRPGDIIFEGSSRPGRPAPFGPFAPFGAFTVTATNMRVVYKITDYYPLTDCYDAEWPD